MTTFLTTGKVATTGTRMNTDALLTLTQWLSPGFPVGAFAYSHGLEQVIDRGDLASADALADWLEDTLQQGSGASDGLLLAAAYRAEKSELPEIDALARSFAPSAERLTETIDQGAAFARTVDAVWETEIGPRCYPVAVGHAARLREIPLEAALEVYLHAFAANLISAAVRLIPLGQTEGQRVLARLAPKIHICAKTATEGTLDRLSSHCFALDIAAMHHETQYSKVFRT